MRRQVETTADPRLAALHEELTRYPAPPRNSPQPAPNPTAVVVPLRLKSELGVLSLLSTITVFGTPVDITVSELAIETFLPADRATANALRRLAASG